MDDMNNLIPLAYLDPGTGSIAIQMVVGGVLGGLLVIKLFWRRIVAFLTGRRNPAAPDDSADGCPPTDKP